MVQLLLSVGSQAQPLPMFGQGVVAVQVFVHSVFYGAKNHTPRVCHTGHHNLGSRCVNSLTSNCNRPHHMDLIGLVVRLCNGATGTGVQSPIRDVHSNFFSWPTTWLLFIPQPRVSSKAGRCVWRPIISLVHIGQEDWPAARCDTGLNRNATAAIPSKVLSTQCTQLYIHNTIKNELWCRGLKQIMHEISSLFARRETSSSGDYHPANNSAMHIILEIHVWVVKIEHTLCTSNNKQLVHKKF